MPTTLSEPTQSQQTTQFSTAESEQYSRQLYLAGFGAAKQKKLKQSKVLLVGAGGLGCPAGLYLAAAGTGQLDCLDFDTVDRSNLHRQIAYTANDIGQSKAQCLASKLSAMNPFIAVNSLQTRLDETTVMAILSDTAYDLIIDGTDNYTTRYLLADGCYLLKKALLQGAVEGFSAQITLFAHQAIDPVQSEQPACYRCVFPEPPESPGLNCDAMGVLGVLPGTTGLMMATEAIKFLTGMPTASKNALLSYNAINLSLKTMALKNDPACLLCGLKTIQYPAAEQAACKIPAEQAAYKMPKKILQKNNWQFVQNSAFQDTAAGEGGGGRRGGGGRAAAGAGG
ncbi:MAG: HesA/MoeB/ThiF family protein, partial [Cyanobacteria bacterium P01_H01_bin.74]